MADAAACMDAGELVHLPAPPDTIADGLRGGVTASAQYVFTCMYMHRVGCICATAASLLCAGCL